MRRDVQEKKTLANCFRDEPYEDKTLLSTVTDAQDALDTTNVALISMTRERNTVLLDYRTCVERLLIPGDDRRGVISARDSLCSSIRSSCDDIVDRKNTVIDQIGGSIFRALSQFSVPFEGIVEIADSGAIGLPDVPGAGSNENGDREVSDVDSLHGGTPA